jgi:phosphoribosylformylglycinamidine synthase
MSRTPLDTVEHAAATPDVELPWAELGLKKDEYERVVEILGRRPTGAELAMYSVMWSEHCSYKSSKVHLRQFGEKAPQSDALLVGIGENAGVVDVGQGYAVTFKVESHNHPSYVEPYQGAATGVGGIVRDIIAMGARPVAVVDPLRFGAADHPDTKRVLPGVVAGIGGYGNCLGLPNIGGEVVFDACYQGNPLVNAGAIGVMRHEDIHLAKASCTGPAPAATASAAPPSWPPRPSTTPSPPSVPPSRSATPSRRSSSSSAPWRRSRRSWSSASRTSARPACRAPRPSWPPTVPAACA